jgi:hypothetical protein
MKYLLDSEGHIRQSNDRKADQRRDNRDRGDPIGLLQLTKVPVGHIRLSSSCSKTQPYDRSKQTPEQRCYAEEHKHGHHQQTFPTSRVADLIIPRDRTQQGPRQCSCGVRGVPCSGRVHSSTECRQHVSGRLSSGCSRSDDLCATATCESRRYLHSALIGAPPEPGVRRRDGVCG